MSKAGARWGDVCPERGGAEHGRARFWGPSGWPPGTQQVLTASLWEDEMRRGPCHVPEAPKPPKEAGRNLSPRAPAPWVLKDQIPGIHLLCRFGPSLY